MRVGDVACPFCASVLPSDVRAVPGATTRLGRGALFAFAVGVAGCASSTDTPTPSDGGAKTDGATDTGGGMALYGAPADAFPPADTGTDTNDTGAPASAYGLPPDAG